MTILEPFQVRGVRKVHKFGGRALIADEMGLGKTITSIAWWDANPHVKPTIVVCPAFVKDNWELEIKKHTGRRARILEGRKPDRSLPFGAPSALIINYEILQHWLKYLHKLKPQLVIVDECQRIKNVDAICTAAVAELCKGVPHILMLGGTGGIENRPVELFAPLHILRPDKFPSHRKFVNRYCQPKRKWWGWDYTGAARLDGLRNKMLKYVLVRHRKKDVLKDLPPKTRVVVPLKPENLSNYLDIEQKFAKWLARMHTGRRKKRRATRAKALVQMGILKRMAAEMKMKAVFDWVDNFLESSNEKIILFAIHRKIIGMLEKRYKNKSVTIHGGTNKGDRRRNVKRFNNSPHCRIFIGQLKATGVGWSARSCNIVGFVELDWVPAAHTQGEDRVHGMERGVKGNPCFAYYFVAKGTIEERLCKLLQKKQSEIIDTILDGGKPSDFNIYNKLMEEIRRAA